MRVLILMLAILFLAACQQTGQTRGDEPVRMTRGVAEKIEKEGTVEAPLAGSKASAEADVVCQRYKKTGSHMTETYCWTKAEHDRMQEKTRRHMHGQPYNPRVTKGCSAGGSCAEPTVGGVGGNQQ